MNEFHGNKVYDDGSTYAWTPEMGKDGIILRLSKSSLTSSKWCFQQLWLSKNVPIEQTPHSYLVIGDDVHFSLEEFYNNADPETISDLRKAAKEGKDRLVLDTFNGWLPGREEIVGRRRDANKQEPFYERDYNHNIDWLMRSELQRLHHSNDESFLPVANEVKLKPRTTFHIDGQEIPVQLVGIIDRVFLDEGGGLALMELKTGKWRDSKMSEMRMEMAYYKMLIELSTPEDLEAVGLGDRVVTHWGWRFSTADRIDYEPVKSVSERAMMTHLKKLIRAYLNESFACTKADFKCSTCNYMAHCPRYTPYYEEVANNG